MVKQSLNRLVDFSLPMIVVLIFLLAFIFFYRKHLTFISELYHALDIGDDNLLDFFVLRVKHFIDIDVLMDVDVEHSIKIDV